MKTLITIASYHGILFDDVPDGTLSALAHAQLVDISGYGKDKILKPSETEIEISFIDEALQEPAIMKVYKEGQKELDKERSRRYTAEHELKKLKERFSIE